MFIRRMVYHFLMSKWKIPHKIKIKPKSYYYVMYVEKFDDPNQIGYCIDGQPPHTSGTRTIQILNSLNNRQKIEVFCHELFHAVEFEYAMSANHNLIYELQKPFAEIVTKLKPDNYTLVKLALTMLQGHYAFSQTTEKNKTKKKPQSKPCIHGLGI